MRRVLCGQRTLYEVLPPTMVASRSCSRGKVLSTLAWAGSCTSAFLCLGKRSMRRVATWTSYWVVRCEGLYLARDRLLVAPRVGREERWMEGIERWWGGCWTRRCSLRRGCLRSRWHCSGYCRRGKCTPIL